MKLSRRSPHPRTSSSKNSKATQTHHHCFPCLARRPAPRRTDQSTSPRLPQFPSSRQRARSHRALPTSRPRSPHPFCPPISQSLLHRMSSCNHRLLLVIFSLSFSPHHSPPIVPITHPLPPHYKLTNSPTPGIRNRRPQPRPHLRAQDRSSRRHPKHHPRRPPPHRRSRKPVFHAQRWSALRAYCDIYDCVRGDGWDVDQHEESRIVRFNCRVSVIHV
jgi:hypothetical protein